MPKILIVLYVIVLAAAGAAAQSSSADGTSSPTPPLPTLGRASAYFDSAEVELDRFMKSICQSSADESKTALKNYIQKISRLHVELAGLRIGNQERGFADGILERLNEQRSRLALVAQIVQPELGAGLHEAEGHLTSLIDAVKEKIGGNGHRAFPTVKSYGSRPPAIERWRIQR